MTVHNNNNSNNNYNYYFFIIIMLVFGVNKHVSTCTLMHVVFDIVVV